MRHVTGVTMQALRCVVALMGLLLILTVVFHDAAMAAKPHGDSNAHDLADDNHHALVATDSHPELSPDLPPGGACDVGDRGVLNPTSGRWPVPPVALLVGKDTVVSVPSAVPPTGDCADSVLPPNVRRAFLQVFRI